MYERHGIQAFIDGKRYWFCDRLRLLSGVAMAGKPLESAVEGKMLSAEEVKRVNEEAAELMASDDCVFPLS